MTAAPLDFSTVASALPAFAFGLDRVRELLALRDAAVRANQPGAGSQAPPGGRAKIVSRTHWE